MIEPLSTAQVEARAKRVLELDDSQTVIDRSRVLHGALVLLLVDAPPEVRSDICRALIRSFQRLVE